MVKRNRGYKFAAAVADGVENDVLTVAVTTHWDPVETAATRPLAFVDHSGDVPVTYFYTHDLTKNICEVLDASGAIVTAYDYTPFGAVTASNSATPNTVTFSSEVLDAETALVYYNYRHYNPADGRWINRDPIDEQGGMNLYAMVGNNSVSKWDILGLAPYKKCSSQNAGETLIDYETEFEGARMAQRTNVLNNIAHILDSFSVILQMKSQISIVKQIANRDLLTASKMIAKMEVKKELEDEGIPVSLIDIIVQSVNLLARLENALNALNASQSARLKMVFRTFRCECYLGCICQWKQIGKERVMYGVKYDNNQRKVYKNSRQYDSSSTFAIPVPKSRYFIQDLMHLTEEAKTIYQRSEQ